MTFTCDAIKTNIYLPYYILKAYIGGLFSFEPRQGLLSRTAMPTTDEHDWIFDYVLQFLESDKFDASVMDFVDEKCFIFDNEDENKLEYTDIHREFKEHIEALISSNLGELGISSDMFFDACEKGRNARDINKQVFERMVAMDDFETFKKLMVKRNMEIQLEAIRSYDLAISAVNSTTPKSKKKGGYDSDEDRELKMALEASLTNPEKLIAVLGAGASTASGDDVRF